MKKIIFVIESMNVGGTEKALLSMISEIPKDKFDITIFILERRGGFLKSIPNYINIKFYDEYENIKNNIIKNPRDLLKNEIKEKKYIEALKTIFYQGLSRITKNYNIYFNNKIVKKIKDIPGEYDLAVSYQGPPSNFSAYLVLNKIKANNKVQWIHSDVSKLNLDIKTIRCLYKYFDKIFVSDKIGFEKPDKKFFQKIMDLTKFSNDDLIMIGDSIKSDIIGAKNSKIKSIYLNKEDKKISDKNFTYQVKNLSEIKKIL